MKAIIAAILSAAGIVLIVGLWLLVSMLVVGMFPYLVHSRLETTFAVVTILVILAALLGAGLMSAIAPDEQDPEKNHQMQFRLRLHH